MKKLKTILLMAVIFLLITAGGTWAKDISVDSALSAGLVKIGNLKMDKDINNGELEIILNSGLGTGVKATLYQISKEKPSLLDFDFGIYFYIEGVESDRVDFSTSFNIGSLQKGRVCLVNLGVGVRLSGKGDMNSRLFLLVSIGGYELMPDKVGDSP